MGGARSHLLGLVPELAKLAEPDDFLLLAQPDLLASLPPLPSNWELRQERAEARGFLKLQLQLRRQLRRLVWEQLTLARLAARWQADVLLSFGAFVPLRSPCPTVLEAGNALPFTHAYWQVLHRESKRLQVEEHARWALLQASLRAAARVLAPTRAMRQDVVTALPELADRVDVVWWGVAEVFHASSWAPPTDATVLGVSKHGINKEFDVLISAFPAVQRTQPGACLVLTGSPDESRWSRRSASLARQLGVHDRVRFVGDVPNAAVPRLIERARVLVLPTWCESFGLPLAEALAMGVPAVAADIPTCREVGGSAALYYRPGDAASLSEAIGSLLADCGAAEALSRAARERGKRFQWRSNAEGVLDTLRRAVG
jgi:glycosyltransferase involved in cell wall biosynthesis